MVAEGVSYSIPGRVRLPAHSRLAKAIAACRRLLHRQPVVVVSGLPRSGTSMAMKMLEAAGVPIVADGARTADQDNPKGYFEDERVKSLAEATDKRWLRAAGGRAVKVISYLLQELPPENRYKVIFMRRDLREILASQAKMLEHRRQEDEVSDEKMLELWESHLWRVGYLLRHAPHLEVLELAYADVVSDPREAARRIAAFLGGGLDLDAMAAAVDASLYRNRAPEQPAELPPAAAPG
jgi:hypothetical protein